MKMMKEFVFLSEMLETKIGCTASDGIDVAHAAATKIVPTAEYNPSSVLKLML